MGSNASVQKNETIIQDVDTSFIFDGKYFIKFPNDGYSQNVTSGQSTERDSSVENMPIFSSNTSLYNSINNPAVSRSKTLIGSERSFLKGESDVSKQWKILHDLANRQERCTTLLSINNYAAETSLFGLSRSLSMRDLNDLKSKRKVTPCLTNEQIKEAKAKVKTAIKEEKIFTIIGPYDRLRKALRQRGWVEKLYVPNPGNPASKRPGLFPAYHFEGDEFEELFHNAGSNSRCNSETTPRHSSLSKQRASVGDGESTSRENTEDAAASKVSVKVPPWEEENGFYAYMSRMLKTEDPHFIWTLKTRDIDYRFLKRHQIVNHHVKADVLTTKIGLCRSLRQLHWFENQSPDFFFPRCYILSNLDERNSFIEDFRLTACFAVVKVVAMSVTVAAANQDCEGVPLAEPLTSHTILHKYDASKINTGGSKSDAQDSAAAAAGADNTTPVQDQSSDLTSTTAHSSNPDNPEVHDSKILPKIKYRSEPLPGVQVSSDTVQFAVKQCELFLDRREHTDIDKEDASPVSESHWITFLRDYYKIINYGATIINGSAMAQKCTRLCAKFKTLIPQFEMDGIRNVWIMKPAAKSRGRGISCYNNIHEMMTIVTNQAAKQDCYVVQKYIERPLLIYNTKFDIRQWILVTDWNPLTLWWYKDCYIRFCSQEFTLEDFNESVHLSNNSIQNKYCNGPRSNELPAENMWHVDQFKEYLDKIGEPLMWDQYIKPGMKEAVTSSLICAQDSVDVRKNSFELYGVDFMISDDFRPWLIEINSSPCMAQSTSVTSKLTSQVLEDVAKVVLDRREERTSSSGKFDMILRQPAIAAPPYMNINLSVSGQKIRSNWVSRSWDDSTKVEMPSRPTHTLISPRAPLNQSAQFGDHRPSQSGNQPKTRTTVPPNRSLSSSTSNLSKKLLSSSLPAQQQQQQQRNVKGTSAFTNDRSPRHRTFSQSSTGNSLIGSSNQSQSSISRINDYTARLQRGRNSTTNNSVTNQAKSRTQSLGPNKVSTTSKQQSVTLPQIVSA